MYLHTQILDLGLILISASIVTILFKWLKQPVVLGYIVVGVLVGSQVDYFPDVQDKANVELWAEIGIIFLLFSLGLEFSLRKMVAVGRSAVVTALCILFGMMFFGYCVGHLLGWEVMDCIFLGGMLSMSSTTIIIKAFDDLGLKRQKFTQLVFGVLVIEDLFAILLLVLLSSIAINRTLEGSELAESMITLGVSLMFWFIAGIFLIPTVFRKLKKYLNAETLLVISVSLCFGMVIFANYIGFSSALGAFIMGVILAETVELKRIERLIHPIKDLFGAIFFVSVGMLVDMEVLMDYFGVILIIVSVVILGQIFFSLVGMLISGQSLRTALMAGFSLVQIGEFAFIIAALGNNLKVTSPHLYPIAVAVSVITTFLTPFIMRLSEPMLSLLEKKLPLRLNYMIDRLNKTSDIENNNAENQKFMKQSFRGLLFYSSLIGGFIFLADRLFIPFFCDFFERKWALFISLIFTSSLIAPFLWALIFRALYDSYFIRLWNTPGCRHSVLLSSLMIRFLVALFLLSMLFVVHYSFGQGVIIFFLVSIVILSTSYRSLKKRYLSMEEAFVRNLGTDKTHTLSHKLQTANLHISHMIVSPNSELTGRYLYKAEFRQKYGVNIISIERGEKRINIPDRKDQLFPYDYVAVVGTEEALNAFAQLIELNEEHDTHTHQSHNPHQQIVLKQIVVETWSELVGKTIQEAAIREKTGCLIVYMERESGEVAPVAPTVLFSANDKVWIAGENTSTKQAVEMFKSTKPE